MRITELFTKTRKEAPAGEAARNAELLVRAGFVDKLSAGVYSYLPLGLRVFENIEGVIRDAMNAAGAQEVLLPSLHPKENWEKTGRWESMDDLYKVADASGREFALAPTHEEVITPLAGQFVSSYRDLPLYVYQFQNKFRMELRAKSGLLRGREFVMKDLYSFHADEDDLESYYEKMKGVYADIFKKVGIGGETYLTFASGGTFSKYSHEFQTVTEAGEDTIYLCRPCAVAVNDDIIEEQKTCPLCGGGKRGLEALRSIEVGNIFPLKTKFSDAFGLAYKDARGVSRPVSMGCYGIGLGRLMGAIVEVSSDERGLVWPASVAPFSVHLVVLGGEERVKERADSLYDTLGKAGVDVLYDDRDLSPGVKFADADLVGIPRQVIVSERTVGEGDAVEVKDRKSGASKDMETAELISKIKMQK